ncbi:MAG: pentapeptide repeat-containing protein [Planctomycetota bacterium]
MAQLRGAPLTLADLSHATLSHADLSNANLTAASLQGADLAKANLSGANLTRATLSGADLSCTDLRGANLKHADLSEADLRRPPIGLILDCQDIRGTRFSPRAPDPWSVLRREYTGPRLLFHLLLLVAFLSRYLIRAAKWSAWEHVQPHLENGDCHWIAWQLTGGPGAGMATAFEIMSKQVALTNSWPRWQLLLGWDLGNLAVATSAILIAYNATRLVLTYRLSAVRDAEERSNFAPAREDYWRWWLAHRWFMRWVVWFATLSAAGHIIPWLLETITRPH